MIEALISLLIVCVVVAIVVWLILWILEQLPMPAPFGKIARVLVIVIGCLVILVRALPLLGISV